jgi:DNA-binding XRE family transcriptional regulator
MTNRDAYIFGWVYGRICAELKDQTEGNIQLAAMRPYSASGGIITKASRAGILKGDLDQLVMEALCQITPTEECDKSGHEAVQPRGNQGSWCLGYYRGKSKSALPPADDGLDIKRERLKRGMTQAQLAEALGTSQEVISRWESGTKTPSEKSLEKLREVFDLD